MGWPTGGDPSGNGDSVVRRAWDSHVHGEGSQVPQGTGGEECSMQDTTTLLSLIQERGARGLPLQQVYRMLYNRNLSLTAYGNLYRNQGAMTKGTPDETVEGMS